MKRLKYPRAATALVMASLPALGWLAHSFTVPHCTDPQTATFCQSVREKRASVTFWGDSITKGQSQIDYPHSWAGLTENYLISARPDVSFTFANISVDGAGVGNMRLGDQPIFSGLPWSEAVRASEPTLLFISIGMNSNGDAFSFGQILYERISYVQSWEVVPTIVLVTPIVPVERPDSLASPPSWVDADAMQVRAIAAELGVLLVDANAVHHRLIAANGGDGSAFLSNKGTGNGMNHPSDIGHHALIYTPVTRLLDQVILSFN